MYGKDEKKNYTIRRGFGIDSVVEEKIADQYI